VRMSDVLRVVAEVTLLNRAVPFWSRANTLN